MGHKEPNQTNELYQHDYRYSKTCVKQPLKKKTKNWLSRPIIARCRSKVLQNAPRALEHYAVPLTFIKLPFVIKIFVLSFFEWLLKTGFTVFWLENVASNMLM